MLVPKSQILTLPSAEAEAHKAACCLVSFDGASFTDDTARLCSPYMGSGLNMVVCVEVTLSIDRKIEFVMVEEI